MYEKKWLCLTCFSIILESKRKSKINILLKKAKNCLLVCMKDGSVHEYEAPVQGKYDTTKSYLIELSLKCRKYKFKSVKSRLRVMLTKFISIFLPIVNLIKK